MFSKTNPSTETIKSISDPLTRVTAESLSCDQEEKTLVREPSPLKCENERKRRCVDVTAQLTLALTNA